MGKGIAIIAIGVGLGAVLAEVVIRPMVNAFRKAAAPQ